MIEKIFIVDDDPFWVAILQKTLNSIGYKSVSTFTNGIDCLKNIGDNPELIFLDYQMEEMDGLEVLRQVKERNPSIGVIFCTAHQDLTVAVDAIKYGSCDYLLKENATEKEVQHVIEQLVHTHIAANKVF